jgi:hypothetical protein
LNTTQYMPESVAIQKYLTSIHIDEWLKEDVFQTRWWILLGLIAIWVLVWYLLLDKKRCLGICLYTALVIVFILGLFEYGDELILWEYPIDVIPIFPPLSSINLFVLPLTYSLVFQYAKTSKSYLGVILAVTAIICFAVEPALSWGGFYQLINWHYYYNYPIYVALAMLARFLAIKIIHITSKSSIVKHPAS